MQDTVKFIAQQHYKKLSLKEESLPRKLGAALLNLSLSATKIDVSIISVHRLIQLTNT